jgi:hypothetical protein
VDGHKTLSGVGIGFHESSQQLSLFVGDNLRGGVGLWALFVRDRDRPSVIAAPPPPIAEAVPANAFDLNTNFDFELWVFDIHLR